MVEDYHKCDGYPETSTWCEELVALRALPSAQPESYQEKLKEIADALSEKFAYMHTCLNERDIILGYLGVKHSNEIHCNTDCTNTKCESNHFNKRLPSAQPTSCDTCQYNGRQWDEEPCDSCTFGGESNHYKPNHYKSRIHNKNCVNRQLVLDTITKYCTKYDLRDLLADIEGLPPEELLWTDAMTSDFITWINRLNNCNTCKDKECKYRPKWGDAVRFNCPFWKGET